MTKNTKTILLSLLACLLLITGFELGEGRIRFGSATLNDSLSTRITVNKGLQVNGVLTSTDTIRTSGILRTTELQMTGASPMIYWTTYGMNIDGLDYNANDHLFQTESGTAIASVDSANGLTSYLPGYSNNGRGLLKTKVFSQSLSGFTPGSTLAIAHGISTIRNIMTYEIRFYDDSSSAWYPTNYSGSTGLNTGNVYTVDATNLNWFCPGASGNWKNAGDTVRWVIKYTE